MLAPQNVCKVALLRPALLEALRACLSAVEPGHSVTDPVLTDGVALACGRALGLLTADVSDTPLVLAVLGILQAAAPLLATDSTVMPGLCHRLWLWRPSPPPPRLAPASCAGGVDAIPLRCP